MRILNCIFVIIGTIIGAGFASGKEIYTFFYIYGKNGIIGLIISIISIGYIIYKTLKIIQKYNINSYDELLKIIIKNKKINVEKIINLIINIFLIVTFLIMCAGFCAYFKQEFKINEIISALIISVFSYIILKKNIKGIFFLNTILIPIIIILLVILGIKSLNTVNQITQISKSYSWLPKAILYASYNSITLTAMLIPLKKYIKNKKDISKITLFTILIIIILAFIIFMLLLNININSKNIELPAVYAAGQFGIIYKYLYGIIILGAIITTAISSAFGFLNNVSNNEKDYKKYTQIICILSLFVPLIGFSNLINSLYPIFGILGLLQLILILKCK